MAEENEKAVLDRKAQEHEMNELKRRIHAAAEAIRSKLLSDAENRSFESELSDLKAKAESGDKDAATEYGWNLISGFATGTPDPEGWTFLKTAADAGHPKALFQVGIAFLQGIGIPKNGEKGVGFIKRSAEAGYPKGMALYARMLKEGNGVEKNEPESVMWLKRAEEAGDPASIRNLAIALSTGDGVPQDFERATDLFQKAARAGDLDSRYWYARALAYGIGIPKDAVKAAAWSIFSEAAGDVRAGAILAGLRKTLKESEGVRANRLFVDLLKEMGPVQSQTEAADAGIPADLPEATRRQLASLFTPALQGIPECAVVLGRAYETGWQVKQDPARAFRWYFAAAQAKYPEGEYLLGFCYLNGIGVPPDPELSVFWISEGAKGGFPEAMGFFGSLLVNGKLGDEMKKDGIPFLEKAAEANDPYGTLNLGLAYLSGTVIALDREKGKALVKKAADLGSDDAASMLESLA